MNTLATAVHGECNWLPVPQTAVPVTGGAGQWPHPSHRYAPGCLASLMCRDPEYSWQRDQDEQGRGHGALVRHGEKALANEAMWSAGP